MIAPVFIPNSFRTNSIIKRLFKIFNVSNQKNIDKYSAKISIWKSSETITDKLAKTSKITILCTALFTYIYSIKPAFELDKSKKQLVELKGDIEQLENDKTDLIVSNKSLLTSVESLKDEQLILVKSKTSILQSAELMFSYVIVHNMDKFKIKNFGINDNDLLYKAVLVDFLEIFPIVENHPVDYSIQYFENIAKRRLLKHSTDISDSTLYNYNIGLGGITIALEEVSKRSSR